MISRWFASQLSFRMGSGAEMVLWYIIPRRFSLLPSRRAARCLSTAIYRAPAAHGAKYSSCHHGGGAKHGGARHNARGHGTSGGPQEAAGAGSKTALGGWRYWLAIWKPLPLSVGLAVLAILQWRRIVRRTREGGPVTEVARTWEITCYRAVPLRAMSRAWGWLTHVELPAPLRPWLYARYASVFDCNLGEAAETDLASYKSLSEFFVRELKEGVRPIETAGIVSPADGRILSLGRVHQCKVEQVKGITYSLPTFLGEQTWLQPEGELSDYFKPEDSIRSPEVPAGGKEDYQECLLANPDTCLYQCVVYLAPGDYHRFHSPVEWEVKFRRHFQGELLSVNPTIARWIPDLFTLNERAVYVGSWKHGFFSLTAVGATNVGSIRVYCDESLVTNQRKWRRHEPRHRDLSLRHRTAKGELFGEFRLGSTIVLIFEAPRDFQFGVAPGQRIKVGQALAKGLD